MPRDDLSVPCKIPEMRRIICPPKILGSKVANHAERAGRERARHRGEEKKQGEQGTIQPLFRVIVSNATAGGTSSMDMNMKTTREQGKRAIDDSTAIFTSNHRFLATPADLERTRNPRLRPTSVLVMERKSLREV